MNFKRSFMILVPQMFSMDQHGILRSKFEKLRSCQCFTSFIENLPHQTKKSNIHKQCIFRRKFHNKFQKYNIQQEIVVIEETIICCGIQVVQPHETRG